jgi:hypothetical protein
VITWRHTLLLAIFVSTVSPASPAAPGYDERHALGAAPARPLEARAASPSVAPARDPDERGAPYLSRRPRPPHRHIRRRSGSPTRGPRQALLTQVSEQGEGQQIERSEVITTWTTTGKNSCRSPAKIVDADQLAWLRSLTGPVVLAPLDVFPHHNANVAELPHVKTPSQRAPAG